MNEQEEALKKMRAAAFIRNNGRVLRVINILRHKYESLEDIQCALDNLDERHFLDCIHFLSEAGYIHLREMGSRETANLADADYKRLEAKVTAQGIRLLGGEIQDKMVDACWGAGGLRIICGKPWNKCFWPDSHTGKLWNIWRNMKSGCHKWRSALMLKNIWRR